MPWVLTSLLRAVLPVGGGSGGADRQEGDELYALALSIGIGPLVAPTLVTTALAERAVAVAVVVVVLAVGLLGWRQRHTVGTGLALLVMYLGVYLAVLA